MEASKGGRPKRSAVSWYRDSLFLSLATAIFVVDQITKHFVRTNLVPYLDAIPYEGPVRIVHVYNSGAAFGLFQDLTFPLIIASLVGIGVLLLVYRHSSNPSLLLRLSLGLQVGGAGGNLLDRVRLGHVTDWVDIGPWPVFNVADACIVTGLVLLAWMFIVAERAQPAQPSEYDAYSYCPICDGEMRALPSHGGRPGGWRCSTCGVRERLLTVHSGPLHPVRPEPVEGNPDNPVP